MPLPEKIFLIGFMGSGKTHWGKIWAGRNGRQFLDLDSRIEAAEHMSVTNIFKKRGEEAFRQMEEKQLRALADARDFVLACGGGTPCFAGNMEWMKQQGTVIYLKATPAWIVEHVLNEMDQRPVISDLNPSELAYFVEKKLLEREQFYAQADYTLNAARLHEDSLGQLFNKTGCNA